MTRGDRFEPEDGGSATSRLGSAFRLARERNGWTLQAVSEHLRIREPYLEAIEDGRVADLPGAAYAVGFVRSYGKVLGFDPDEVARRFRSEAGEASPTELSFPAPVPERGVPALAVVAVGAVLVIGAYAAWYRLSGDQRPGPEAVQAIPDRLSPLVAERGPAKPPDALPPASSPPVAGAAPSEEAALAPPPDVQPELPPELPRVSPSQAAAAAPPPPPTVAPTLVPASRILVRARARSWILVKDPKGQVLINRILMEGETWPVPSRAAGAAGQPALLLTTGNAGGTELVVDGIAAASLGNDGSVRRDLPLDPDAIKDGKLAANTVPPFRVTPHNQ